MSIKTRTSGIMVNINVEPAASAFTGPLDLAGSASIAYGFRALSAAIAGSPTKIIQIRDDTTTGTQDFGTNSDGTLDTSGIAAFLGGHVGSIPIIYDQSGNGNNALPLSNRSIYSTSPLALACTVADTGYGSVSAVTLNQPFSMSSVARTDAAAGTNSFWGTSDANPARGGQRQGSGYFFITVTGGEVPRVNGGTGLWFAIQGLYNGASSVLLLNGSSNTDNCGAGSGTTTVGWNVSPTVSIWADGFSREFILWNSDIGGTARANIENNQRTFWGF